MRAAKGLIRVWLFLFSFTLLAGNDQPSERNRWQLEISGGLHFLADNDLGLFTKAENQYLDLYFRTPPQIETVSNPGLKSLQTIFSGRAAIQYRVGRRFRVAAGLDILDRNVPNTGTFTFRNNQGWRILTDSLEYLALDTHLRLVFPNLGLSYHFPVNEKIAMEASIYAGPVFATARFIRHIMDRIEVFETGSTNNYLMYQDERMQTMDGTGMGVGAAVNVKIQFRMNRRMGIFAEIGSSFYSVNSLKGPGTFLAGGQTREWEEEWFLVGEEVEKSWGSAEFKYPSNDPNLEIRQIDDFTLRAFSFLTLRVGVYIHL